ncbi:glycosyl transferase family 2 [Rhodoblastus sphagnicola]|uniref:Glycosyl transferase family 2 n=1 Tax=Rhodoblastus sphagnicola TaxID=333368 RepID=A0A2S6N003_9HYPH|nr:glycosyltransferase [Rhodoblastus sphagnicola]MBB4197929.1 hopene-associated glycosyltransferase HpnB [Rhodoblastus sphagnicola]PPQ27929.1 glycosyl transferase family 2 [Rhodoblastus sphagnicola]
MIALGVVVLAIWLVLIFARGKFWACLDTDFAPKPQLTTWPAVVAVVPARDEAELIAQSMGGLLAQDYPGDFRIVLVDDQSSDGTAEIARALGNDRLRVLDGSAPPEGWTGKLWAMAQGVRYTRENFSAKYILFTDADIFHEPDNLRMLVARAEADAIGLTSLMALLRCQSFAEKLLVPAFVYFFQMLYPFRWARDSRRRTGAAAGGCMLVRPDLLATAGGIESLRGALIDDCALAARMKTVGPVWLGLTRRVKSLRPYPRIGDIGRMISRSAYAQLGFSPWRLAGAMAGLVATFVLPVILALRAPGVAGLLGALAFGLMIASFMPINRFYGLSRARAALLPGIAAIYMVYTLRSALDFYRGRGGMWKGRAQAQRGAQEAGEA